MLLTVKNLQQQTFQIEISPTETVGINYYDLPSTNDSSTGQGIKRKD